MNQNSPFHMLQRITFVLLAIFLGLSLNLSAQKTAIYSDAELSYKRGMSFYDKGLYGQAQMEFKHALEQVRAVSSGDANLLKEKSELYYARTAVRLEQEEGEKLVLDFIRRYSPSAIANEAKLEIAHYYYNDQKYEEALQFYELINPNDLGTKARTEMQFKQAYSYFVRKKNKKAKALFKTIKEEPSEYYHPANYYYGMCSFFDNEYTEALNSFETANETKKYNRVVPYYIAQIYFAEGKMDKVISYGKNALETNNTLRNRKEINLLVGQAYFEKKLYTNALPYFDAFTDDGGEVRAEDLYQIGFAQYKSGRYKKAIKNFEGLGAANSELGQSAMYYLADCYLKTGKKQSARTAFGKASRMNFNKTLQEEALFNYAKISYEVNNQKEALNAIQKIKPESKYYNEAQVILSNLLLNTRDYASALRTIENMPNKTSKIRKTYQKVAYLRGLQLYLDGDFQEAERHLNLAISKPADTRTTALAYFWLGEMAHKEQNFTESISKMDDFLAKASGLPLPDESSVHTANYTQGYNYLKRNNFNKAAGYFVKTVEGLKNNFKYLDNDYIKKQVYPDALLRAGDGFFKKNRYADASKYYKEVIQKKYSGFDYALYQSAIIDGLKGDAVDKIVGLEDLIENYPNSLYADDALYSLGITYFEIGKNDLAQRNLFKLVTKYKGRSDLINDGLLRLGLIAYNNNDSSKALNYYKQIFANNPSKDEEKEALAAIEEIYVDQGEPEKYFAFLESIPGYDASTAEKDALNYKAADAQYRQGEYAKAIKGYSKYIKRFPSGRSIIEAYYNRAESNAILKNYDAALVDYDWVFRKGNSEYFGKALFKAAEIAYNHQEDFQKAYTYYSSLAGVAQSEDQKLDAQLGALRAAWRLKQADAVYQAGQSVSTNNKASKEQKTNAYFYMAKMALDQKNYSTAAENFREVITLSKNELAAESRFQMAYIAYIERDLSQAKILIDLIYKEGGGYEYWLARTVLLQSDIYAEQGDIFNAKATLEGLIDGYKGDQSIIDSAKAKLAKLQGEESPTVRRLTPSSDPDADREMDDPLEGGGNR